MLTDDWVLLVSFCIFMLLGMRCLIYLFRRIFVSKFVMTSQELDNMYHAIDVVCIRQIEIYNSKLALKNSPSGVYASALTIEEDTAEVVKTVLTILGPIHIIPKPIERVIVEYITELIMLKLISSSINRISISSDNLTKNLDLNSSHKEAFPR